MKLPSRKICSIRPAEESLCLEITIKEEGEKGTLYISSSQLAPDSKSSLDPIVKVEKTKVIVEAIRAHVLDFEDLKTEDDETGWWRISSVILVA